MNVVRTALVIAVLAVACVAPASAQVGPTTAALGGKVDDTTGGVLPGATVTATDSSTGFQRSSVTGADGRYSIPSLPPGVYTVSIQLAGFNTEVRRDVVLALGTAVNLDFTLNLAGTEAQVVVRAETSLVDVQRTSVARVVSETEIETLPINGRNFISFALLTPGVNTDRTPQQGAAATSGLTFAGQRARSNNVMVDGLDNVDQALGAVRATFSQEAVQEFQVLTSGYSAEFGKASGGVINIVTRSGTNTLGGNLFYYFRDDALNAREYFERFDPAGNAINQPKAPFRQQQFGGTLGGPIRTDRSFYFLSFERLDTTANNFVNIDNTTPVSLFGRPAGTAVDILAAAGFPVETGFVPYAIESTTLLTKWDHRVRPSHNLTVRFSMADELNENIEPWGGTVARSRGGARENTDAMVAGSYTSALSSRFLNEARGQVSYRDQTVYALDPRCSGLCDRDNEGGPTVEVSGVASAGRQRFTPQPRQNLRIDLVNTLGFYGARHELKAGIDVGINRARKGSLPAHFGGRFIFGPLPAIPGVLPAPVTAIQALAAGLPSAYVQGYGNPEAKHSTSELSLFAEDTWRPVPSVTLKAGVRYQAQYFPEIPFDVPGLPAYTFPSDFNNVAPRLGATWNSPDQRTVVRGAYGIFFDNHITGLPTIADIIDGGANVRTLVLRFPEALAAWQAPGRRLPEAAVGAFPSLAISIDPELRTPFAHHAVAGVERELPGRVALTADFFWARGKDQIGTIDYNPTIPALGPRRRPLDVNGVPGTSASVLQYTSFGETWYKGLTIGLTRRQGERLQLAASYTLSKAEDNSTDYQSAFVPQDNGFGRNPADPTGLPIGFDPDSERGPSLQDQRHRLVVSAASRVWAGIDVTSIITAGSGRPYNILAGVDLNGDGDGGNFPSDRARTNPADPSTSLRRNAGTLPAQAWVDLRVSRQFPLRGRLRIEAIADFFNLFNRTNFTEINGVFGTGAFPDAPLPAYGQFERAAPPFQMQLAGKLSF